jgi:hypothetical protein
MLRLAEAKNSTVSRGAIVTVSRNNGLDWGPSIVIRALSAAETCVAYLGRVRYDSTRSLSRSLLDKKVPVNVG